MEEIFEKSFVVYLLTDLTNSKKYVGKTTQMLKIRLSAHKCNKKTRIGRAIRSHGWENFKVEILEECTTEAELDEREMYWIKTLNTRHPNGYNLTDGGEGSTGRKCSEKVRTNHYKRAVRCIDTNEVFSSVKDAAEHLKISTNSICKVCHGIAIRAGGLKFEYVDAPLSEEARAREAAKKTKAVRCVETGVDYESIHDAAERTGISRRHISGVCNGECKTTYGLHFEFVDDELRKQAELKRHKPNLRKKPARCLETGVEYESITAASKDTGILKDSISFACYGKLKTAGGYHWQFVTP